jgi:hypothetical protein
MSLWSFGKYIRTAFVLIEERHQATFRRIRLSARLMPTLVEESIEHDFAITRQTVKALRLFSSRPHSSTDPGFQGVAGGYNVLVDVHTDVGERLAQRISILSSRSSSVADERAASVRSGGFRTARRAKDPAGQS